MVDDALARALAPHAAEHAQAAPSRSLITLSDPRRKRACVAKAIGRTPRPGSPADRRAEASLLARMLASERGDRGGGRADDAESGWCRQISVLGPFRDTAAGSISTTVRRQRQGALRRRRHGASWGSYDVAHGAKSPERSRQATGHPARHVHPPSEGELHLGRDRTRRRAPAALMLHAASTGQIRVVFDGVDVGARRSGARRAAVQPARRARRGDVRDAPLAAKVCSGALDDDGRGAPAGDERSRCVARRRDRGPMGDRGGDHVISEEGRHGAPALDARSGIVREERRKRRRAPRRSGPPDARRRR